MDCFFGIANSPVPFPSREHRSAQSRAWSTRVHSPIKKCQRSEAGALIRRDHELFRPTAFKQSLRRRRVGGRSHDARLDLLVGYGEQVDLNKKVRIRQAGDSNHRARRRFVRIEELRQLGILQRLDEFVYVNDERPPEDNVVPTRASRLELNIQILYHLQVLTAIISPSDRLIVLVGRRLTRDKFMSCRERSARAGLRTYSRPEYRQSRPRKDV
jgi:hypothetical protein